MSVFGHPGFLGSINLFISGFLNKIIFIRLYFVSLHLYFRLFTFILPSLYINTSVSLHLYFILFTFILPFLYIYTSVSLHLYFILFTFILPSFYIYTSVSLH